MTWESDSSSAPDRVPAVYFDGQHSARQPVMVAIYAGTVAVTGPGISRSAPIGEVEITEPLGTAPRLIRFRDGAFCEIDDAGGLAALLSRQGLGQGRVAQWEGSLRWIAVSAALFVVVLILGYKYGVPALAAAAADRVPTPVVELISGEVMTILDGRFFTPTALARERQAAIVSRFEHLRFPEGLGGGATYKVVFRKSDLLGPNAMALPSGTIVVTDALVALAKHDDEVVSVLAHEAGHVDHRHGLRQLFQNSVVGLAVTWFIGDISMLAAAAPTALLQAKYSRDLEREADTYALEVLRDNDISVEHFARMLERLETATSGEGGGSQGMLDYLSSHPVTRERIESVVK